MVHVIERCVLAQLLPIMWEYELTVHSDDLESEYAASDTWNSDSGVSVTEPHLPSAEVKQVYLDIKALGVSNHQIRESEGIPLA